MDGYASLCYIGLPMSQPVNAAPAEELCGKPPTVQWPSFRTLSMATLFTIIALLQCSSVYAYDTIMAPVLDVAFLVLPIQTATLHVQARQDSASAAHTTTTSSAAFQLATQSSTPLPRPFDASLGNNFTAQSCPQFFNNFLENEVFQSCLPFSLLLQTSNAFFSMSRSLVKISQVMDATCNVNYSQCSTLMSLFAAQIRMPSNCGQDLQYENPLVLQAYNGFLAYDALYQAGCLKDSDGDYCYGAAMMNATDPSTYYIYYLPLGVQLPSTATPTCNECLQGTMGIFATKASNGSVPLGKDYIPAARTIDSHCGSTFVDQNIHVSAAASRKRHVAANILGGLVLTYAFIS